MSILKRLLPNTRRRCRRRHEAAPAFRHLLLTRYNIRSRFGVEGGIDPTDPDWLEHRASLFEKFCAPSVEWQTVRDFEWVMFVDPATPQRFLAPLERCATLIRASGIDDAVAQLAARIPDDGRLLITSRIDNDDSIVREFMAEARKAALEHRNGPRSAVAFSHGVHVDIETWLAKQTYVPRSPFMTLIETAPPWRLVSWYPHNKIDDAMPLTAISTAAPMWLQTVHGRNASNSRNRESLQMGKLDACHFAGLFPGLDDPERTKQHPRLTVLMAGSIPESRTKARGRRQRPGPATGPAPLVATAPKPPVKFSESDSLAALDRGFGDYVATLRGMARTGSSPEIRQAAVDRLIVSNGCEEALIRRRGTSALAAASFRRSMFTWSAKSQFARPVLGVERALEWVVSSKEHGYGLARMLGATVPERAGPMSLVAAIEATGSAAYPILVKPVASAGSHGVFVVHGRDAILDLRLTEWIGGLEALQERMAAEKKDKWLVEQYIAKPDDPSCPAPDLKFFCFYGKIALVLEVERFPVRRYAWWTAEGKTAPVTKSEYELFDGAGFTPEQAGAVAEISAKLPLPYARIDFLRSGQDLYFGEFTPRPGDFEKYDEETDQMMGRHYLEAELRLHYDLLAGKRFAAFMEWAAPFLPPRQVGPPA